MRRIFNRFIFVFFALSFLMPTEVKADPINSINGYFPPKGQFLFITQYRSEHRSSPFLDIGIGVVPVIIAYSPHPRITFQSFLQWQSGEVSFLDPLSGEILAQTDRAGIATYQFYTAWNFLKYQKAGLEHKVYAYLGLDTPVNASQRDSSGLTFDDGVWSPIMGASYRFTSLDYQVDASMFLQYTTAKDGFDSGQAFSYNLSFQRRIWPWTMPEYNPVQSLYFLLEFNGIWTGNAELNEVELADTNSHLLRFSPGLQYVYRNIMLDFSVQLPLLENLPDLPTATEMDINIVGGIRVYF